MMMMCPLPFDPLPRRLLQAASFLALSATAYSSTASALREYVSATRPSTSRSRFISAASATPVQAKLLERHRRRVAAACTAA